MRCDEGPHRGADVVLRLSQHNDRSPELLVGGGEQGGVVGLAEAAAFVFAASVDDPVEQVAVAAWPVAD